MIKGRLTMMPMRLLGCLSVKPTVSPMENFSRFVRVGGKDERQRVDGQISCGHHDDQLQQHFRGGSLAFQALITTSGCPHAQVPQVRIFYVCLNGASK